MSEAGKRLIKSALQALDFAEGRAETGSYRVHFPETAGETRRQDLKQEHERVAKRPLKRGGAVTKSKA